MRFRVGMAIGLVLAAAGPLRADRTLSADDYLDRLHGMWLGQILGNYAGRPVEGQRPRGGLTYDVPWDTILATSTWQGDDDTCFEYLYGGMLASTASPTSAQIHDAWLAHVPATSFYIANRQARWLMDYGLSPPETGGMAQNIHWYAIDSQITTEGLGAAAPGMRQTAADLAAAFGGVSNDGLALHAAQFYAAMYAAAPFETSVETVVAKGLEVVPTTSRTCQVIQDVRTWYADDAADGTLEWRTTQERIYDTYGSAGSEGSRYRGWIESAVNTALTTMAILYGQGDFRETVAIGVQGGFDCDCNPATAGGLVGLMVGYTGLPADLTAGATDEYEVAGLANMPPPLKVSEMAGQWQAAAERQILDAGGTIDGAGPARTYHLPDADDLAPLAERPDPAGPAGLVGLARTIGGSAAVSASVDRRMPAYDRLNLDQVVDGITDVSYNGHLPYTTNDGANPQPEGGDWYALAFDRPLTFTSVVFWEGDIQWDGINNDPRVVTPWGGYFENLAVEVRCGGVFVPVSGLALSEPLDPYTYFQRIEMTFDPAVGDAIRIRGDAGGTRQFTSIVELEARGRLDLADGVLVVDYAGGESPFDAIAAHVASGLHGGPNAYWDGPGIASSAAAADAQHLTALGMVDDAEAESVVVRYTWWGDANLDGKVDSNDYDRIDTSWLLYGEGGSTPPGGFRWAVGDFNYDGRIDSNDYDKIDTAWLRSGGAVLAGGMPAPAPEPATLALLALGGAALAARRRRG